MRILLALVALCRWRELLAQELTTGTTGTTGITGTTGTTQRSNTVKVNLNIADKRLKFVNIIKDDLRRNNDDYALLEQQKQLAYPAPPAHPPQPQPPAPRLPYRKRMLAPGPRPQPPPRQYYDDKRRGKGDMNQSFQDDNAFRSYTHSKNYKIERENKLKRLLNKENVRMREVEQIEEDTTIDTLPETKPTSPPPAPPPRRPPAPTPSPPSPPTRSKPPRNSELRTHFTPQRRDTPPPEDTDQEAPVLRQRKEKSQSPSPDQLDMAAARNPEITRIRLKGRLCQRSMMNMEGPTYDRLGNEAIPAYKPRKVRGRKFHQTRAPDLVLPRCCNCCKKSVLGCQ